MQNILKINNLSAGTTDGVKIIKNLSLEVPAGEIHVLMGPNGSGKSTLAKVISGHPGYQVDSGSIIYKQKDITSLEPSEKSLLGIFLAFQYPLEVPGVNFSNFLRLAYNARQTKSQQLPVFKFRKLLKEKAAELEIDPALLDRNLNEGLSGGEKKKMEILQIMLLQPELLIMDETDSGLDLDAVKTIFTRISEFAKERKNMSVLIITHYQRIFSYIKPDKVHLMSKGEIIRQGGSEIIDQINKDGFKSFKS